MTVYFIAHGTIKDPEKMERYVEASAPFVARYGGEWISTGEVKAVLIGSHAHKRTAIFKFPSMAHVEGWYYDPDYRKLWDFCQEAGDFDFIAVEEYPWVEAAKKG